MESEDRSSTASTISGIYRNILLSPAPICMFYFSHPFGISTPKNSSNDNNNNNEANKNYSTSSTRNHKNRQTDFYDHNKFARKQTNTNDGENIMDNHTASYIPWPRNTWLRKEYDLPPLVQLLALQNDNNVPGLEEILQTIRQAWNTPKGERSLNHSRTYNINKIQLSSSQTAFDCIDKTYTMGSGTANMNPGPGLLRRRYSVPEIIMRKHSLAQQKAYEESVAATTAAPTPYPLSPKMTPSKIIGSSSSATSSASSNQDQNDQMGIKRNRPIFSSTASDSNLSSSRRSGGCGYNNGIGYGAVGHGEESMRRQLLRRIWSKEFKRLESRSGSWSPPMRRSQRRLPPVEPMDKCEQCLKLDETTTNNSQQNGIHNIINNSAISKRLRLHSSPTYSIIDNKSCRNTKCNNISENSNYEDVLNNNLQTTTTTTNQEQDTTNNNEIITRISTSTHEIVESEDSSQFSDSSDFIDNKIQYNNDSNNNNNMITYMTSLNPMSPPKSPFTDDNQNNNNNSETSHDNNNNNKSEIIKNDNRILKKNYSNENRQPSQQSPPPTSPSPSPLPSSLLSSPSPLPLPLQITENTNANDKSICSRLDENEHIITKHALSCKENSNENSSFTNTIVKQINTLGNVNDEGDDSSQTTDQYISNLLINNLNNSNIKNYNNSNMNMKADDELNERLNAMQQYNNNDNNNNKSIKQMDLNKNENDFNNNNINVDVDEKKSQSFIVSSVYLSPQRLQKISNNKTTTLILSTTTITTTAATTSSTTTVTTSSQDHLLIEDVINNNNNNINNNLNNVLKSTEEIYFPQYSMESKADQSNYSSQCSTNADDDQDDESPLNNNVIHVNTGSTYPTENLVQPIFVTRLTTYPRTESMEVQPPSASTTDDIEIDNDSGEMIATNKTINNEFKPIKHSNEGQESEDEDDDSLVDSLDDPMSMQSMYTSNQNNNNNNNPSVDESTAAIDKKSQFEIKSQTFFVPMTDEENQLNKRNQYNSSSIAAQMPDKIREKLDKRQQNLDLKKQNEQIRKQKKIQQIMKRGMMMNYSSNYNNNNNIERKAIKSPPPANSNNSEKIDSQDKAIVLATDNTEAVPNSIAPNKKSIKNNVTLFSTGAGAGNRQNRNKKILRSEIGMLETYTIDARGNMKFKAIQQTISKPKQAASSSNNVIIVEPIINQKQRSSKPRSDQSTNNQRNGKNDAIPVKRSSLKKSIIEATNNDNQQKSDQDIITPGDVECGPRRMYQKTEIHDGEKRIEILEIVECIDSAITGTDDGDTAEQSTVDDPNVISSPDDSMSSAASSSSSSSSTSPSSSSTLQIGCNKLSIINNRKSKIPIPVFKPIINNVSTSSSEAVGGHGSNSKKFTTIAKTTTTTTTKTNVVDQMIADLLIEALNHPNELNIEFINKTTSTTTTKRDLIKNATNKRSIKSRRNLSKLNNGHKPINGHGSLSIASSTSPQSIASNNTRSANGTKYQQIFDVIPEEKSSLSIDSSSNEDAIVSSTTTTSSSSSIFPVSSVTITKGKHLLIPTSEISTTTTTVSTAPETSTDENNNNNDTGNNSDKNNYNNDHNGNNVKPKQSQQQKNPQQMHTTNSSEFKRQESVPSSRGKAAIENDSTEWLGFFKRHESGSSMDSANEDEPDRDLIRDSEILNHNTDNNNNPSLNTKSYLIPLARPSLELPDQMASTMMFNGNSPTIDDLSNSLTTPTTISSNDMMFVSSSGSENILSIIEKTFGDDQQEQQQQQQQPQDSSSQTFLDSKNENQNVQEEVKMNDDDKSNEECSINFLKECISNETCNSCGIQKNINLKEKLTLDDDEEANKKSNFKLNNHKSKIIKQNNNNNNNENIWNQVKNSIDDNTSNLEIIGLAATINRPTMMYMDDGSVLPTRHDIIDRQSFIVIKDTHQFDELNNDLKKTWKSPPMIIDDESSNRIRERCSDCCYCNPNLHKNKSANTRKNCNYCKGQLMQKQTTHNIDDDDDLEDIKNNNKKEFHSTKNENNNNNNNNKNNNSNQTERNNNQNDKYYESMTKSDHTHIRTKSRDSDTVSLKCTKINQHIRRRFIPDDDDDDEGHNHKDDYYKNDNLRFTDRNSRNITNRKNRENVDNTNVRGKSEDNRKQHFININRSHSRDKSNDRYIRLSSPNGHRKTAIDKDNNPHLSQSFDESSSAESSSCSSVSESSTIISPLDHRKGTLPLSQSTNPWESSNRGFQHNNKAFFETTTAAVTTTTTATTATSATVETNALSATITTIPTVAITPATSSQPSQRSSRYEQFYENNNNNNNKKKNINNNLITKSVGTNKNNSPKETNSGWSLTLAGTYHDDMAPDVEMRLSFPTTTTSAAAKTITKTNINRAQNKINGNHLLGGVGVGDDDDNEDVDDDEDNINNNKNDIKTIRNLQKIKNVSNGNVKSYHLDNCQRANNSMMPVDHEHLQYDDDQTIVNNNNGNVLHQHCNCHNANQSYSNHQKHLRTQQQQQQQQQCGLPSTSTFNYNPKRTLSRTLPDRQLMTRRYNFPEVNTTTNREMARQTAKKAIKRSEYSVAVASATRTISNYTQGKRAMSFQALNTNAYRFDHNQQHQYQYLGRERQRDHSVDLGNLSSRRMSFESQPNQLQTPNTEIMALSVLGNAIAPEQKPRVPTMSERDVTRRHHLCFTRNRAFFS